MQLAEPPTLSVPAAAPRRRAPLPWFGRDAFPLYLAPMAGFTDGPFRRLAKAHGADVLVTEFANAEGLVRGADAVWRDLAFTPAERPLGVQIFGGEPAAMAAAARLVEARLRPDFIDLNFGCPAPKVTCRQAGSALLRDLPLLEAVARAVVRAVPETPVTAKIRLGWDAQSIVALDAARRLEDCGVCALAVHGRTKEQGYRGEADWAAIASVADGVAMPVIGNGGVDSATLAVRLRHETKVAGLMIGRAALGYPWIFASVRAALDGAPPPAPPALDERWRAILAYADDRIATGGRDAGNLSGMRAMLKSFAVGVPEAASLRAALEKVNTREELGEMTDAHLARWRN